MKKTSITTETLGSYIRKLRIKNDIGQRELAKKIGVAPSYLNDMEKNKRTAPRTELIKKLSVKLKADLSLLYDLAGNSKKTVAPDIVEYVEKNPKIVSLLRTAKSSKLSDYEIDELEKKINKSKTKALVVAAGLGSRLKDHTENLPKCMLDFGGKTLLERQIQAYKNCGIENLHLSYGHDEYLIYLRRGTT